MKTVIITARGQIKLDRRLLSHLGVATGDKVRLDKLPGGQISIRAAKPMESVEVPVESVEPDGQRLISSDEINRAVEVELVGDL